MKVYLRSSHRRSLFPRIINTMFAEHIMKVGIEIFGFQLFCIIPYPYINLCEPVKKAVTSNGMVLVTESDEQDKLYITNRSRGFEISYHDYEIKLNNGKLCIYKYKGAVISDEVFEDTVLNEKLEFPLEIKNEE